MKTILVFAILCPGEPPWYAKQLYLSEQTCKTDAYGTAMNLYLAHGKKCSYKCVQPDWTPEEQK